MLEDLIRKNRSCRRFYQENAVDIDTLRELVNLGRLSASGANLQPLKYILSVDPKVNEQIFSTLAWAGYLKDWPGPKEGERPSAYILILCDTTIGKDPGCDHGIAAQSILLGAREKGLAGCMIASIRRDDLRDALKIPPEFKIVLAIAIGKPKEKVEIENFDADGSIKYWRDENGGHHVPKRSLNDILVQVYST